MTNTRMNNTYTYHHYIVYTHSSVFFHADTPSASMMVMHQAAALVADANNLKSQDTTAAGVGLYVPYDGRVNSHIY